MNSIFTLMIPEISIQTSKISECIRTCDMSVLSEARMIRP